MCRRPGLFSLLSVSVPGSSERCVKLATCLHNVREAHMIDIPSDGEEESEDEDMGSEGSEGFEGSEGSEGSEGGESEGEEGKAVKVRPLVCSC